MARNLPVPIVNNAPRAVTFVRQNAGSDNRGMIIVEPGRTHYEPGPNLTYETLVLKVPNEPDQVITLDELADDLLESIEVDHNFQLVRHQRRNLIQRILDWIPRRFRARGAAALPI